MKRHSPSCSRCRLIKEAEHSQSQADNITVSFYEKLLPVCADTQYGIIYELMMPDLLALQRDALLILAEVCVPKDLTLRTDFTSRWREEQPLQRWRNNVTCVATAGATCKKYQSVKHVLEHPTFIVPNRRDAVLLMRDQPVNPSLTWCVKDLTCLKTVDERYSALQDFVISWEHDENMVIASKSEAHPALHLLEFEAFGGLRAGAGLQLPRLLRSPLSVRALLMF